MQMPGCPYCYNVKDNLRRSIQEKKEKLDKAKFTFPEKLFNDIHFADFKVKCNETVFSIPKVVLAGNSEVFEVMLRHTNLKEAQCGEIEINDPVEVVEAMLRYMFYRKPITDENVARGVLELAHRYQILDLKDKCEVVLAEKVKLGTLDDRIHVAYKTECPLLLKKCFIVGCNDFQEFPTKNSKTNDQKEEDDFE